MLPVTSRASQYFSALSLGTILKKKKNEWVDEDAHISVQLSYRLIALLLFSHTEVPYQICLHKEFEYWALREQTKQINFRGI